MVFSSMIFLCVFLPVVLIVYYVLPKQLRNLWLLLASLFFYAWGEPRYILIMLFSTVFDYCNGRIIAYATEKGRHDTLGRAALVLSVVGNLGILRRVQAARRRPKAVRVVPRAVWLLARLDDTRNRSGACSPANSGKNNMRQPEPRSELRRIG